MPLQVYTFFPDLHPYFLIYGILSFHIQELELGTSQKLTRVKLRSNLNCILLVPDNYCRYVKFGKGVSNTTSAVISLLNLS